ncbi:MAG: hypothetical protein HQL68_03000 [Magnetococcales bacterium]|nr:hypothetical protein [Magnetococcales bacterium]
MNCKMKALFIVSIAILLSACAKPNTSFSPVISKISRPSIGDVNTVKVGEVLLTQGNYHEEKYLTLPYKISVKWAYTLHPGKYNLIAENDESGFYVPAKEVDDGGKITKSSIADSWQSLQAFKNSQRICVITITDNKFCKFDIKYNQVTVPEFAKTGFKQTLVYNGKHENKISIGYLTFYNDNKQTRFNNTIEYDLDKSDIIEYRGAEIKIIAATQQDIKYSVIKNFKKK